MKPRFALAAMLALCACSGSGSSGSGGGTGGTTNDGGGAAGSAGALVDGSGGASGAGGDASVSPDASAGAAGGTADAGSAYPFPTKIEHVFVLVKENHTFDNYFTGFPGATTTTTAKLSNGTTITRAQMPAGAMDGDISHTHASAFTAWNGGKMNGFDKLSGYNVKGNSVRFAYYPESRIPNYWALAKSYVLFDHFFSTTLAPSTPGHIAIWASQSPAAGNASAGGGCQAPKGTTIDTYDPATCKAGTAFPCFSIPTVIDDFPQELSWRAYAPGAGGPMGYIKGIGDNQALRDAHFRSTSNLLADLKKGDIPNLLIANISSYADGASEHPSADPCQGENLTVSLVDAIMNSAVWQTSAIVVTWDDWGGWYDHVKPATKVCSNGGAYNPGFRVPAIVISPYAKTGVVDKTVTEQASIPRLVEDVFSLPRMHDKDANARDAVVGSMLDAFDFTQPPRDPAPLALRTCPPAPYCDSSATAGKYCGNDKMVGGDPDVLYTCPGGNAAPTSQTTCSNGCVVAPAGQNDACK